MTRRAFRVLLRPKEISEVFYEQKAFKGCPILERLIKGLP